MTQEEKARAYDEALKRAKAAIDIAADKDLVKGIAKTIFPELSESEDERVRKEIIEYLTITREKDLVAHPERQRWITYLEKQKEKTENATKTLAKILKDSAEGFRRILMKKGIDYEVSDKFWENEAGVYSKEEKVKFYKWMDDLMASTPVEETHEYKKGLEAGMKQKEQKLTEWSEFDKAARQTILCALTGQFVPDGALKQATEWFEKLRPEKQEWSEEDEEMLEYIIGDVIDAQQLYTTKGAAKDMADKEIIWLKSLKERFKED